ncbi:putative transcription factor C2H2 family [Helianthus annuus]|uniref:Transcription factor C2H2 family n=1 Tax=Helianthus annuus TaxID=4232 RepID=A0A9K3IBX5_HELAN|nr:putative transcription factor C2H2 family [Helianthus annuus]
MGPHEPYWRTNTSFSPPPPRWDMRYHSEGQSFGSQEGSQLYGSSTSSNSRETRSWLRGGYVPNHQHSVSDGVGLYISSPSDFSPAQQWTPPAIREIGVEEFGNSSTRVLGSISVSPIIEGISFSAPQDSRPSVSSLSDGSDYEPIAKSQSSHRNFTTRRCFMSKPVHPLTFPPKENATVCHEHRFSMASYDLDFTDVSEPIEPDSLNRPSINQLYVYKCGLCERFLSQRSPYSSHRIVKSGDFPVTGVLPCRHVFHAECLDQTTPKTRKNDPLCPICGKSDEEITSPEQRVCSKLKNGFPKLKPFREDGPSRPWGCTQAGNCVEGALTAPSKNTMLLLSRNRVKKSLSLKSNSSKKNGSSGSPDPSAVGPSKTASCSGCKPSIMIF